MTTLLQRITARIAEQVTYAVDDGKVMETQGEFTREVKAAGIRHRWARAKAEMTAIEAMWPTYFPNETLDQ